MQKKVNCANTFNHCEIEQRSACRAHNPKVNGSNPFFTKI